MLASPADGAFLPGSALGWLFNLPVLMGGPLAGAVLLLVGIAAIVRARIRAEA